MKLCTPNSRVELFHQMAPKNDICTIFYSISVYFSNKPISASYFSNKSISASYFSNKCIFITIINIFVGTFALLPRDWISLFKKSYDLQICTRPTCRGILRDGIRNFFFFEPEVIFFNLQSPKFTPSSCASWLLMADPDVTHSCHVMCVTDEMFGALIFYAYLVR